ncbi:MAG: electron transfer flavoprotein subunit alpha [Firmicutes bacterium]|nr:electron transfer flavoprotein subunit alpha [Bacillota bacterium]
MALVCNHNKCDLCQECIQVCPFDAIIIEEGKLDFTAACKMCNLCIKSCPQQAISLASEARPQVDKAEWQGVLVFVEHVEGKVHPVTYELVGKARELAAKISQPVYALLVGHNLAAAGRELLDYGVDKVFTYDYPELEHFRVDTFANAFEDCINNNKPTIVLVGATSVGRSLAPRVATRFRTGLTADCTVLDVKENSDLVQIRPAFGGNIMAQIVTPNHRPQLATVRYKVMDAAQKLPNPTGIIVECQLPPEKLRSAIEVLQVRKKQQTPGIAEAEVLVAAGRGIKEQKDMAMVQELAELLGGQVAVTRPLIEAGWGDHTQQIGLSGRTVRPKLLITLGISGAVQFTAGMGGAETVIAINKDSQAPIFDVAHYGVVGDIYEILPELLMKLRGGDTLADVLESREVETDDL